MRHHDPFVAAMIAMSLLGYAGNENRADRVGSKQSHSAADISARQAKHAAKLARRAARAGHKVDNT